MYTFSELILNIRKMQGQSALIEPHLNSRQYPLIYYLVVGNKKAMFVYVITFWTFVQLFQTRHAFTYMILKWPFVSKSTITFFTFQIFFWLCADTCINISSVVEFQRWWVLKSKIFGQNSSKENFSKIRRWITVCQKVLKSYFQSQFSIQN